MCLNNYHVPKQTKSLPFTQIHVKRDFQKKQYLVMNCRITTYTFLIIDILKFFTIVHLPVGRGWLHVRWLFATLTTQHPSSKQSAFEIDFDPHLLTKFGLEPHAWDDVWIVGSLKYSVLKFFLLAKVYLKYIHVPSPN